MDIVNLSDQNSVLNKFLVEIRDIDYQKNRLLFRNNINRIGFVMAYEISKTLHYETRNVVTPLQSTTVEVPTDELVIATVLRAGLPFHNGFLSVFDDAENGFVSAFRMYTNREHTEVGVHTEYQAAPSVDGKTLLICDPMLATGGSMVAAIDSLLKNGTPNRIIIASVIATPEGIEVLRSAYPDVDLYTAAIDAGMNEHKYIVPGFGDAGDLCFGEKL